MKTLKKLIPAFALLLLLASPGAYAQVNWTLAQTAGNVDCYYSLAACNDEAVVFLKFVNNNTTDATITWKETFDAADGTKQAGEFGTHHISLPAGTSVSGDCSDSSNPECIILPSEVSWSHKVEILGFAFSDINVVR